MSEPEHVLVTGGAGFIGSHLVESLDGSGVRVSVLDDLSRGSRDWIPADTTLYEVDVRDSAGVAAAMQDARPDAIAHLAALHFIPAVDDAPELAWSINVGGTENVLAAAAAAAAPPQRVVFASTAAVYANLDSPLNETLEPAPIDLYGRTKVEGERLLRAFAEETGCASVAARLFNVTGPRETNPHVLPEIIGQLRDGATELELGNLEPRRDFVDVRDVADALHRLLNLSGSAFSAYNVGTGRAVSVHELVRECELILGRSITIRESAARKRVVERMVLIADPTAIGAATGWAPAWTLRETLAELLAA